MAKKVQSVEVTPKQNNQLQIIVKESGLEPSKAQYILEKFQDYFEIAAEWEQKAKAIVVTSPSQVMEMQADILDITWDGGNATASNPFFNGSGAPVFFTLDQVAGTSQLGQWNDTFNGTGRTMTIGPSSIGIARHRLASSGEVLNPATFTGTIGNGLGGGAMPTGGEFDGSGTLFVGFQEAGSNDVGWYQIAFTVQGPIFYGPGQFGSMGESVTVGGGTTGCTNPLGDVNLDGVVSLLDVAPFVALLTGGGFQCEADVNEDGVVSLLDVNPFVVILTGG